MSDPRCAVALLLARAAACNRRRVTDGATAPRQPGCCEARLLGCLQSLLPAAERIGDKRSLSSQMLCSARPCCKIVHTNPTAGTALVYRVFCALTLNTAQLSERTHTRPTAAPLHHSIISVQRRPRTRSGSGRERNRGCSLSRAPLLSMTVSAAVVREVEDSKFSCGQ